MHVETRDSIRKGILRLRARWWQVSLVRSGLRALFYALACAALTVFFFPALGVGSVVLAVLGVSALVALGASAWLAPDDVAHAKACDDASGLADRLSSAVELARETGPMAAALHRQAAEQAAATVPAQVYRYRLPPEGRWLPVPTLLLALAFFLPAFLGRSAIADQAFESSVERRAKELEELISEQKRQELGPRAKELLEELERLKAQLDQERVDKRDTQAEVARLLDQLKKEEDDRKQKEQELRKLLKALQENTRKQDLDPSLQQGDYQKALNKLKEELERLQKELERKKKEGASPEELKELEEEIEKLKEIETKMMQLLALDLDLAFLGKTVDFLQAFDGELGDLAEFDPAAIVPGEPCPLCAKGEP